MARRFGMTISQKRTCRGCAASRHHVCDLGFDATFASDEPTWVRAVGTPHEPCPKPLTNSELIEAGKHYTAKQISQKRG